MSRENFEIDTDNEGELEDVEIFDRNEDFDGHIPIKYEKPTFTVKLLKFCFGIGAMLMVFSFGYKIGCDEMAKNNHFDTLAPTPKPTITASPTRSPTRSPTPSPNVSTEGPTVSTQGPTPSTDGNATRLLNEIVNPFTLSGITQEDIEGWKKQYKSLSMSVSLLEGTPNNKIKMYHKTCENFIQPPPATPRDTLGWISMLCRYYMPTGDMCDLSLPIRPRYSFVTGKRGAEELAAEENLNRYTKLIAGKIKRKEKLRVATFGTSVMAGQDNCYNSTFTPTFQRALSQVTGLEVEVFNLAQNGDGDAMSPQLICSDAMLDLDTIDMIVAYWDMIPQSRRDIHEEILKQWLNKGILVTFLSDEPKWLHGLWNYAKSGVQFVVLRHADQKPDRYGDQESFPGIIGFPNLNPWYRHVGGHWGKHDTGRCHLKTREGFDAVLMQNWHPGALTNQIFSDVIIFQILMAMYRIGDNTNVPALSVPNIKKSPVCVINHGPMPNKKYDLREARVKNIDNPYKETHENDESSWGFYTIKHSSNMGSCKDLDVNIEKQNHACNAHVDSNAGFVVKKKNEWITIKLKAGEGHLWLCRPNIKRNGLGVSIANIELRINNEKYAIEKYQAVCAKTIEQVPINKDLYVSVKTNSLGLAFNSLLVF